MVSFGAAPAEAVWLEWPRSTHAAGKASKLGLVQGPVVTVQEHVTQKALDGLYFVIGEEERRIRKDPIGTGSALLKKVFGAL